MSEKQTQKNHGVKCNGSLDLLCRIADTVAGATPEDLDPAINQALEDLGTFTGVDRSFVIVFSSDKLTFTSTHEWCAEGIHSQLDYFINLPMTVFPWTARQILAGHCVATNSLDDYPPEAEQERQICLGEDIQSIVFMPILSRGKVIGAIGFDSLRTPHTWSPDEIALLKTSGTLFAACLEQRRADAELRKVGQLERRKLGQDLHDSLGQEITGISLSSAALSKELQKWNSPLAERAAEIGTYAMTALNSMRDLVRGLKSFDVWGAPITEVLTQLAHETEHRARVNCTFIDTGVPPIEDPETCTQLLWIARESINNAVRHGKAGRVEIVLDRHGNKLSLSISDDGIGLPDDFTEKKGIGLKIMRFRAAAMGGQMTFNPGAKMGARVCCVFPSGTFTS